MIPTLGIILFVILYVVATFYYPGGSQLNKNEVGFSWTNNYWCNLLNEKAINGAYNPAKPIALTGMFILCVSLAVFWFVFPKLLNLQKGLKLSIQISGILAMSIAYFLFTTFDHDLVTNLASIFGLIATIGTFIGLYQERWYGLFAFGILNLLIVGINNYVYYNKELIIYLPVIQKLSFATFLVWICSIDILLIQKMKQT